jgi:hypothetical protein
MCCSLVHRGEIDKKESVAKKVKSIPLRPDVNMFKNRSNPQVAQMQIRVDCYAGYWGEESPRQLWLGNKQVAVKEILDRWLAPDYRYFKIRGDDDAIYIVRHVPEDWSWELTFYQKPGVSVHADGLPEKFSES